jgi:pilus assembly protein CpaF
MFALTVTNKAGKAHYHKLTKDEFSIGRVQANDVVLPRSNISKRHATLVNNSGTFVLVDHKSTNGTYVNGQRISGPYELCPGDKIFIGEFVLEVGPESSAPKRRRSTSPPPPPPDVLETVQAQMVFEESEPLDADAVEVVPEVDALPEPDDVREQEVAPAHDVEPEPQRLPAFDPEPSSDFDRPVTGIYADVHERLRAHMSAEQTREDLREKVITVVHDMSLPTGLDADDVVEQVVAEALGLGPLQALLGDPRVSAIFMNGPQEVFVEQDGKLEPTDVRFVNRDAAATAIETLLGRAWQPGVAVQSTVLASGARVHAVLAEAAPTGPVLTVCKAVQRTYSLDELAQMGTLHSQMADFLRAAVRARSNILVAGAAGAGRTTLLCALAACIDRRERTLCIEDALELCLSGHVVRLTAGPHGDAAALVDGAAQMRAARVIVGDCVGREAWPLLRYAGGGRSGAWAAVVATDSSDALRRVEVAAAAGVGLPPGALQGQALAAFDLVIFVRRTGAVVKVVSISQCGDSGLEDLFVMEGEDFVSTGVTPRP